MKFWISFHRAGRWQRHNFEAKSDKTALLMTKEWLNSRRVPPESPVSLNRAGKEMWPKGELEVEYDWEFTRGPDGVWR